MSVASLAPNNGLLAQIGRTPMVRLSRILPADISPQVEVWAKLEFFNPGGSVKDRAALHMVLDAEARGLLQPGDRILDASSGNTGIAYALIAATRGYHLTLCLPRNASAERKAVLRAYGAEIIDTDPLEGSDGAIRIARQLHRDQPDSPFHGLEGLKHMETSIQPGIYDPKLADETLWAPTEACIELSRGLARREGLLAGTSSGAQVWGAIQIARRLERGLVVTLLPDSGERYLSER